MAPTSDVVPNTPTLPLHPPKVSSNEQIGLTRVSGRRMPLLEMQLKDRKLAPLLPHFTIRLLPIRVAFLQPAQRSSLRLSNEAHLLIQAQVPELLGDTPLSQWTVDEVEIADLAYANSNSGAVTIKVDMGQRGAEPVYLPLTPMWLDWQGWSGVARLLSHGDNPPDTTTLHHLTYELEQRSEEAPTGLNTALARLHAMLDEAGEAAAACQDEVSLSLNNLRLPTAGAVEALVLLGQLLQLHGETDEARAALLLAVWVAPNHQVAHTALLPLLTKEEAIIDSLARLSAMPHSPPDYKTLLTQSAERLELKSRDLESRIKQYQKQHGDALWPTAPTALADSSPKAWMRTIGF